MTRFLVWDFFYDDGSHFWYGSRHFTDSFGRRVPCHEMSFCINGRLEERITELQALTCGDQKIGLPVVLGFKVQHYPNWKNPDIDGFGLLIALHLVRN